MTDLRLTRREWVAFAARVAAAPVVYTALWFVADWFRNREAKR